VDSFQDMSQVQGFLKSVGFRLPEDKVRIVVLTLLRKTGRSQYDLWAHGRRQDGSNRNPVCGKGTVYKIRGMLLLGRLESYVAFLESHAVEQALPAQRPVQWPPRSEAHQDLLVDLMVQAASDLQPYRRPLPQVWDLPYRPDPGSGLQWVTIADSRRLRWELAVERDPNWGCVLQHVRAGLRQTLVAFEQAKTSYEQYCQVLTEAEDAYRTLAAEHLNVHEQSSVTPDDGRFYRTILAEVDKLGAFPEEQDYQFVAQEGRILVQFDRAGILSAAEEASALEWMGRHLQWRTEFVNIQKPTLTQLCEELQSAADEVCLMAGNIEAHGGLPGTCGVCAATKEANGG